MDEAYLARCAARAEVEKLAAERTELAGHLNAANYRFLKVIWDTRSFQWQSPQLCAVMPSSQPSPDGEGARTAALTANSWTSTPNACWLIVAGGASEH